MKGPPDKRRPMTSDIGGSGMLEQLADVITFVYREAVYIPTADPSEMELIVEKNRGGSTDTLHMVWKGDMQIVRPRDSLLDPLRTVS